MDISTKRPLLVPIVPFPLPVHHGVMLFGLFCVALVAATLIYKMFFSPDARREVF